MIQEAELMTIFDFTEDDLAANRAGRISERQTKRLERQNQDSLTCSVLILMLLIGTGCLASMAALSGTPVRGFGTKEHVEIIVLVVVWLAGGLFAISTLLQQTNMRTTIRQGIVDWIDGDIQPKLNSSGKYTTYLLEVRYKEIYISKTEYEELKNRADVLEEYALRVYYVPNIQRVVAAEVLDTPQPVSRSSE